MPSRNKRPRKSLTCELCQPHIHFDNPKQLQNHQQRHHKRKCFSCPNPNCPKQFYRTDHLKRHLKTCTDGQKKERKSRRSYNDKQRIKFVKKFKELQKASPHIAENVLLKKYLKKIGERGKPFTKQQWQVCLTAWEKDQQPRTYGNRKNVTGLSIRQQKRTRQHGGGRTPTTITPKMHKFLRNTVIILRGPPPESSPLFEEPKDGRVGDEKSQEEEKAAEPLDIVVPELETDVPAESWDERAIELAASRIDLTTEDPAPMTWDLTEEADPSTWDLATEWTDQIDLTDEPDAPTSSKHAVECTVLTLQWQLRLNFGKEYKARSSVAWYTAIDRWCRRNGLRLRRVNRKRAADESLIATQIRALRLRTKQIREGNPEITDDKIANLDETALDFFSLESSFQSREFPVHSFRLALNLYISHFPMLKTLHYSGVKAVRGGKGSKLNISMPTVWFANGSVEFIVIWYSRRKNEKEHKGPRWQNINGVWWQREAS